MFYAKSTGGFYDAAIHGSDIPADAVDESKWSTTHDALMLAQSQGKVITADANGCPIAVDPQSLLTLAEAQAQQTAKVSAACAGALVAGFTSSALGSARTYGSNDKDQRNLLNAAMAAQGQPSTWSTQLWCANSGVWSLADHTVAEVQQVNADWLAFRLSQQQKCASLTAKISAATTVTAVLAIGW